MQIEDTELDNDLDLAELDLDGVDLDLDVDLEEIDEATAAADSIEAKPSRTATLADIVAHASSLSDADLNGFHKSITKPGNPIPNGAEAKNKATIATKTVTKEELEGLFGDDLSEEFKDKTTTLFESAVNARVGLEIASLSEELNEKHELTLSALEEAYGETLSEEIEALSETLYEKLDNYINYVASEWMVENEVAIEKSLRSELAEDFMTKMKDLFLEHNLNIPEDAEDTLSEMIEANDTLQAKVDELTEQVIDLRIKKTDDEVQTIFSEETQGLAATKIDQIKTLAEGIEYDSSEAYAKKLRDIVEITTGKVTPKTGLVQEEAPAITEEELVETNSETISNDPAINAYAAAITANAKKIA